MAEPTQPQAPWYTNPNVQRVVIALISAGMGFLVSKGILPANTPVIVNVNPPSNVSSNPNPSPVTPK